MFLAVRCIFVQKPELKLDRFFEKNLKVRAHIRSRILSVCTQNLYTMDKFVKSIQIPEYLDDFLVMNILSNIKM